MHQFLQFLIAHPKYIDLLPGGYLAFLRACKEHQNVSWSFMKVHTDGRLDCLLHFLVGMDGVILDLDREQFAVHLNDWTVAIVVGECLGIEGCTRNDQL